MNFHRSILLLGIFSVSGCYSWAEDPEDATETDTSPGNSSEPTESATEPTTVGPTTDMTGSDSDSTTVVATESETSDTQSSSVTETPPECGNGEVEEGEDCDNGEDENSDEYGSTCNTMCKAGEFCGDGEIQEDHESCDEGTESNSDDYNSTCNTSCTGLGPHCGDNVVQEDEGEECDSEEGCQDCYLDRHVFVSSIKVTGGMTGTGFIQPIVDILEMNEGIVAADMVCQELSNSLDPSVEGTFQAWLGDSNDTPETRFLLPDDFSGRFVLHGGGTIADGWFDLIDGSIAIPINRDETGAAVTSERVWTGLEEDGQLAENHCEDWMSDSDDKKGLSGRTEYSDSKWTNLSEVNCDEARHLYCFQTKLTPP